MKLSVVIPARNEEGTVEATLLDLGETLRREKVPHEIIVVDDGSSDATGDIAARLSETGPGIRILRNAGPHGFGNAVRLGLRHFTGDAVAIMMADGSDSAQDLVRYYQKLTGVEVADPPQRVVRYYQKLTEGYECVFGSRFIPGAAVIDYPVHKLVLNRLANWFVKTIFGIRFNDVTNAFKVYRREAIEGMEPLISPHFNLTVEMPLKAIVRGYSYTVIPINWTNRATGVSKLKIKEMGSRYLFIVLYLWLEKVLARGDYRRSEAELPSLKSDTEHV